MLSSSLDRLPEELRGVLATLTLNLETALGSQLISALVFGGVARGHFAPGASDVNLLLVVQNVSLDQLDAIAGALAPATRQIQLRVMTLAQSDLADSAEVFSTKFLDIQRFHLLLSGRDVADQFAIPTERLVRQAKRELMNLTLRLRQVYIEARDRPELLAAMIKRSITPLVLNLGVLLELKDGRQYNDFEELAAAAAAAGFDTASLRTIRDLKHQRTLPADLKSYYQAFIALVEGCLALQPQTPA